MRVRLVLALLLCATPAFADKQPKAPPKPAEPAAPKPWAVGVPQENQDKALALYKDGNVLLEQSQYKDALEKFTAALAFWDHPAIHYNAAVCLINLDRPVDAYEHLVSAMRYGDAPLGNDLFNKGQAYQEALARQIGEIDVTVQDPGAVVTLDGEPIDTTPGKITRRVKSGDHQLVTAKKPDYQTDIRTVHVNGGDVHNETIVLKPIPVAVQRTLRRRWDKSRPYEVAAAGGVLALASLPFFFEMSDRYAAYRSDVATRCTMGCVVGTLSSQVDGERTRGNRDQIIGWSAAGVGAVAVVAGVVGLVLNQPRLGPPITPMVGADHVGAAISGRW